VRATQDLHELGDAPESGTDPTRRYASLIRRERHGEPVAAFRTEVVDVPLVGRVIDPCPSRTFGVEETGLARRLIRDNRHPAGKLAVRVGDLE
jgi:hypothetical protein